ncbi:methyltransferase domain-containing protein [Streptomyces sp. AJS327]|uniref:methyltransferase n=1 Tax=Streptomyces sp. AJS327 TaxID=2545265 RepID=UPI0015DEED22|nr:methyltransferase [Streptomyces sp. AJS327]MBA0052378.1 methyltransferase domain-containing protein [Streptomyces sp. AJS327]
MRLLRLPGVYAPQGDSQLLLDTLRELGVPPGARALDLFTGTGVVALATARLGARRVHAVDSSADAVLTTRRNARALRLPVVARQHDVRNLLGRPAHRFDLVTANPPYVPCPPPGTLPVTSVPARHRDRVGEHTWRAGPDGRDHLDALCATATRLLAPGGVLLLVHSEICDSRRTLRLLRAGGLRATVAARRVQRFGPVLHAQAAWLERRGLIRRGQREEELVVVRAQLPPTGEPREGACDGRR